MEEEFLKPIQKSKLWLRISDTLKKNGYTFQATECHAKWRNLMCTYRKNVDRTKESGGGAVKWEYFHTFHEVYGNRSNVDPPNNYLRSSLSYTSRSNVQPHENNLISGAELEQNLISAPSTSNSQRETETERPQKRKKTSDEPPLWFKKYLEEKKIEDQKKAEIEEKRWTDLKKIEEEKLNAMKQLTDVLLKLAENKKM
ncbi:trihelix transcription factor GTL1-like [Centruroides sculpturatus]|uniref:trihelix transcription factor GTL1-like n=1 Tax=Centruroides sculpturatus TaxID=218467 RepID=UPI000C6DF372|nr:trihelix transcription factor GTL1-like [Centruroides sculpturatus]